MEEDLNDDLIDMNLVSLRYAEKHQLDMKNPPTFARMITRIEELKYAEFIAIRTLDEAFRQLGE